MIDRVTKKRVILHTDPNGGISVFIDPLDAERVVAVMADARIAFSKDVEPAPARHNGETVGHLFNFSDPERATQIQELLDGIA